MRDSMRRNAPNHRPASEFPQKKRERKKKKGTSRPILHRTRCTMREHDRPFRFNYFNRDNRLINTGGSSSITGDNRQRNCANGNGNSDKRRIPDTHAHAPTHSRKVVLPHAHAHMHNVISRKIVIRLGSIERRWRLSRVSIKGCVIVHRESTLQVGHPARRRRAKHLLTGCR